MYKNNARGIFLDDRHTNVSAASLKGNVNFIVAYAGYGNSYAKMFPTHVQTAYDIGVPCIAYFKNNPELYLDCGLSVSRWPRPDVEGETEWQIQIIDRMLFIGDARNRILRKVQGFILDCSKVRTTNNNNLTPSWIAQHGQHMLGMIWERYRLPNYMFITSEPFNVWPGDQELIMFLKNNGISTVSNVATISSGGLLPVPADTAVMTPPYRDSSIPWYFWQYSTIDLGGITTPLFLYNGYPSKLYDELGYVAPTPTPQPNPDPQPNPNPDPTPDPQPSQDYTQVVAQLKRIADNLDTIAAFFQKMQGN